MSRCGVHCHERGAQNLLVVQNRVARSHRSIAVALVGEDLHSAGTVERGVDLLLGHTRLVHLIVAIREAHCVAQNALDVLFALVAEQHTRILHLTIHSRLHVRGHMLQQSLLGIFLHRRVDRGIDLQTITIDVVVRAVGLLVLLAPAVERVVIPLVERLIEIPIVVELRTLGAGLIHHQSQHLAEVGCRTVVVRDGAVVELNGQCRERIVLLACDATIGTHTRHHRIAACNRVVVVQNGVVARGLVHNANQHRSLLNIKLIGRLVEERARCRLDTVGIRSVFDRIEIHRHQLLLGVVVFELYGCDPLFELRDHQTHLAHHGTDRGCVAREEVLGYLLSDRTTTALTRIAERNGLDSHADQRLDVDTRVRMETFVLGRDQCCHNGGHLLAIESQQLGAIFGEELGILDIRTVLYEERADDLAIFRVDFGCDVALGVFQLLERGQLAEQT